jgi:hypothetical protein
MWDKILNSQKNKISNNLRQICKITGEQNYAITSGAFTTTVNNAVQYVEQKTGDISQIAVVLCITTSYVSGTFVTVRRLY